MPITPSVNDPAVAVFVYLTVLLALVFVFASSHTGLERTQRLLFLYLTYSVFEIAVKRAAHFQWYVYPVKFGLFFLLLMVWASYRKSFLRSGVRHPLRGLVAAYLGVAAVQIFNPYQGNPVVGVLGWLTDFIFVPLYFIGFEITENHRLVRRFLWLTAWLGIVSAVGCFLELWIGPDELAARFPMYVRFLVFTDGGARYRPSSLMPFIEIFAIAAMMALLLASRGKHQAILFLGIVTCALASILHAIRITWATGFLFLALFTLLNRRRTWLTGLVVAASVIVAAQVAVDVSDGLVTPALASVNDPIKTFQATRLAGLLALPRVIRMFPFGLGVGEASPGLRFIDGTRVITVGSHNYLTELTVQLSLIGPVLLLMFSAGILFVGVKALGRVEYLESRAYLTASLALFGAIVASFFIGGALGAYPVTDYFWLTAGMIARMAPAAVSRDGEPNGRLARSYVSRPTCASSSAGL